MKVKVNILDSDYLNNVNTKRLDDLRTLDTKTDLAKDKLAEFLDRESSASRIKLHQGDIKNSLLNRDILKEEELLNTSKYETPLRVSEKFRDFPSLD